MASIDEYWILYDRALAISQAGGYEKNPEYLTMLRVIGISMTVEYLLKSLYENTIGQVTRWLAHGEDTHEDVLIQQANRAYSDLMFDQACYAFDFWSWAVRIWREPDFIDSNLIRKYERKLFFTLECGIKALYARLIGSGAGAAYQRSAR
jgi:hypothetical protein